MSFEHQRLAGGAWKDLSLVEQLANIGSEVGRSLRWKQKNNMTYADKAAERALELMDLSLGDPKNRERLRELARIREIFADHFWGSNHHASTEESWTSFFGPFTHAARKDC